MHKSVKINDDKNVMWFGYMKFVIVEFFEGISKHIRARKFDL
jgi:hypothetical protein